ncbi:hypothetical protein CHS0354_011853 [Potamilus streckersoni]|uniref:Retrotransposon gag domain-containing protein n=1 Tax=Potamilus streckersoni TaxID=2493646 RepID=A0AAE0SF56_9BIVA|nr:hypothetical protein CHS0354_011853 [Potamilus streckersoni]
MEPGYTGFGLIAMKAMEKKVSKLENTSLGVADNLESAWQRINADERKVQREHKTAYHRTVENIGQGNDNNLSAPRTASYPNIAALKYDLSKEINTQMENLSESDRDSVYKLSMWTSDEKLDELLPRLQVAADEFVFGHLSHSVSANYEALWKELASRFRIIESAETYGTQFSHRDPKYSETVEGYVAELKKLYDNLYVKRDEETRQEDLLRFLNGLIDDKARFHVYVKEPKDMDDADF